MNKKYISLIIIAFCLFAFPAFAVTICQGFQGCTGYATTTVSNVGNFLKVVNTNPLTYTFGSAGSGGVSTSSPATSGTISMFSGSNALTNSVITQQNGLIGINTNTPSSSLHVIGDINVVGNLYFQMTVTSTPFSMGTIQPMGIVGTDIKGSSFSIISAAGLGGGSGVPGGNINILIGDAGSGDTGGAGGNIVLQGGMGPAGVGQATGTIYLNPQGGRVGIGIPSSTTPFGILEVRGVASSSQFYINSSTIKFLVDSQNNKYATSSDQQGNKFSTSTGATVTINSVSGNTFDIHGTINKINETTINGSTTFNIADPLSLGQLYITNSSTIAGLNFTNATGTNLTLQNAAGSPGFIMSPTQILATTTAAGAPCYSFQQSTNTGMCLSATSTVGISIGGFRYQFGTATMSSTNPFAVPAGTVSNASIQLQGAINTGLFFIAGSPAFTTAGVEKLRVTSTITATVPFWAAAGSAIAPSYSFSAVNATSDGMYDIAPGNIALTTGGTKRWDIGNSTGIGGVPSSSVMLHIFGPTLVATTTPNSFAATDATNQYGIFVDNSTPTSSLLFDVQSSSSVSMFNIASSGLLSTLGTSTASLGGSLLAAVGNCTSIVTTLPILLSTSTDGVDIYPQNHAGVGLYDYNAVISRVGATSTDITSSVCAIVIGTPAATKTNIFPKRMTGL